MHSGVIEEACGGYAIPSAESGSPPYFRGHTHTACDEVDVGGAVPDYKCVNIPTLHVMRFTYSLYCER